MIMNLIFEFIYLFIEFISNRYNFYFKKRNSHKYEPQY